MRSDHFRLRSRVRSFESSNPALKWRRAALRFNIEEIVPKEIEDRSLKEFGSVNLPRILRSAFNNETFHSRSRP
jgi:hypothetical protein